MLIDLHTHTRPKSYDAFHDIESLVAEAKALGIDALCITEHDAFWDHAELARLSKQFGMLLLPGCEVNTDDGHFLAFGLKEYKYGMHRMTFLRRLVGQAGGVIIAAHPYRRRFSPPGPRSPSLEEQVGRAAEEPAFSQCDAIETINGHGTVMENRFSAALADKLRLPATAGTDAHQRGEVGLCATRFEAKVGDLDDLIREIKAGRCSPVAPTEGRVHGL
ncbi:MAG: PHP domain-containing protein [SAR202 cluster bacterium]|nr:PHP domain-containing protein [SAR202 cluster bacterium]